MLRFWGIKRVAQPVENSMNILALGIGNLGGPDLFIILLIVLVLFGAKKLPDLARSLGQSVNEFRKAREEIDRELHNTVTESSRSQPCPSTQQVAAEPRIKKELSPLDKLNSYEDSFSRGRRGFSPLSSASFRVGGYRRIHQQCEKSEYLV